MLLTQNLLHSHYIAPNILFEEAKNVGLALELDKFVRIESIKKFKDYYEKDSKVLLFLNFESSSINNTFQSDQYSFKDTLQKLNIPSKNIVLEVKEDEIESTQSLQEFSNYYKNRGFNIAIDDFGTGDSQFDRLSIVKPDIVKIDKSLLRDVGSNDINAQILRAIANMCHSIGAIALAEGVEYESEILKSLNFGIDIFQGYWFAHPSGTTPNEIDIVNKIQSVGHKHKEHLASLLKLKNDLFLEASTISKNVITLLKCGGNVDSEHISTLVQKENIEAIYLIDTESSKQLGNTLFMATKKGFYEPSVGGDDHSLKEYFYICKDSKDGEFITKKYISGASGNICRTLSKKFMHNSQELILCIDLYL